MDIKNEEYSIETKNNKVIISLHGFLKKDHISLFLNDYDKLKTMINPKQCILILNGKELTAFPQEMEQDLVKLYIDYTQFMKIYIVNPTQIVTKMQIKRVLKTANIIDKFEFIDSVDDVK